MLQQQHKRLKQNNSINNSLSSGRKLGKQQIKKRGKGWHSSESDKLL